MNQLETSQESVDVLRVMVPVVVRDSFVNCMCLRPNGNVSVTSVLFDNGGLRLTYTELYDALLTLHEGELKRALGSVLHSCNGTSFSPDEFLFVPEQGANQHVQQPN